MKKLLVVLFLIVMSFSSFAITIPKTGEDWLALSGSDKLYYVSMVMASFQQMDYIIVTQYSDSVSPEVKEIRNQFSIYSKDLIEVVNFLDKFYEIPMNQSTFIWDVLTHYDVYNPSEQK